MGNGIQNLLSRLSIKDIEKLKALLTIVPEVSQKEIITLRVFAEEYSNLIKQNRSKAYFTSVELSLKHFTNFFGPQKSIQSIGLKDIENFVSFLQQRITKPATTSRGEGYRVYIRNLKAAFNKAIDWGYVKENYFHKVKLPKKQQVNPAFINSHQLSEISKQISIPIVKDVVTTAFYTGMRLNELMNLTWRNVDLTTRTITVGDENYTTKGRNQRYVPICDEVFEVLIKRRRTPSRQSDGRAFILPLNPLCPSDISPLKKGGEYLGDYVFSKSNGFPFTGNFISKKFKHACRTVGMDRAIHFHSLRHSFASNLAQRGVPLYTIKELLGHSSISTTEIYSHLNMDSLRNAIKMLDGKL